MRLTGNSSHAHHRRNEMHPPVTHLRRVIAVICMKIETHLEVAQKLKQCTIVAKFGNVPDSCLNLSNKLRPDKAALWSRLCFLSVEIRPIIDGIYSLSPLRRHSSPLHRA